MAEFVADSEEEDDEDTEFDYDMPGDVKYYIVTNNAGVSTRYLLEIIPVDIYKKIQAVQYKTTPDVITSADVVFVSMPCYYHGHLPMQYAIQLTDGIPTDVMSQAWLTLRQQVAVQLDYGAWVRGEPSLGWTGERVSFVLQAFPGAVFTVLLASAVFLIPLALLRKQGQLPAAQVLWLGLFLMPPAVLVLAPALAASGSVFRSTAVFMPMLAALAGGGLEHAATWGAERRGYPKAFVVGLALTGVGLISAGVGWGTLQAKPSRELTCPHGPGPYLASDPLSLSDRCAVQAHLLPRGVSEQEIRKYLDQYPVQGAVLHTGDGLGLGPEEGSLLLGWQADPQGILRPE